MDMCPITFLSIQTCTEEVKNYITHDALQKSTKQRVAMNAELHPLP